MPLARIVEENTDCVPGCNIIKHGYVVFSTTYCGDTYCFDLNYQFVDVEPRVILMCCEHDYESMTPEGVHSYAIPIATNLLAFLEMYVLDQLEH